jgi:hypothetical protein
VQFLLLFSSKCCVFCNANFFGSCVIHILKAVTWSLPVVRNSEAVLLCVWFSYDSRNKKELFSFNLLKTKRVCFIQGLSAYRAVNTPLHFYRKSLFNVVCFILGNSPASEVYMPTFRNTLFHLHKQVGMCRSLFNIVQCKSPYRTLTRNVSTMQFF